MRAVNRNTDLGLCKLNDVFPTPHIKWKVTNKFNFIVNTLTATN